MSFSSWEESIKGVHQKSVLKPLLFNLYLNDLFYFADFTEVCNFADDTTLHGCDNDLNTLIMRLEHGASLAIDNIKLNKGKMSFLSFWKQA